MICATVILLGITAFSCCITAEFRRVKDKDMRLDGSLCSLPRRPAFALAVAALACLSVAQIVGTTTSLRGNKKKNSKRNQAVSITLLVLSWISFALAAILLGTASSMSNRQPYGRGWMDGECYVVKDGIFVGAAVLAAINVLLIITLTFITREIRPPRTGPDEERPLDHLQQDKLQLPPRPTPTPVSIL